MPPDATPSASSSPLGDPDGRGDARRRLDQGIEALRRLVPLAGRLTRAVTVYVVLVSAAASTIVVVLLWRLWPSSLVEAAAHVVVALFLLGPVLVLWLFRQALAEALQIPERLLSAPEVARGHGRELADLVRTSRVRRDGLHPRTVPGDLWRSGRLLLAAHDDLPGYGAVLALVSVPFLLATGASAALGLAYVLVAPIVLAGGVATALV